MLITRSRMDTLIPLLLTSNLPAITAYPHYLRVPLLLGLARISPESPHSRSKADVSISRIAAIGALTSSRALST